jgi:peptidoglycan/LPS O-acetylase OafA/YrhL
MTLQFEQIRTTERSHWLDVLRGLAIFGVVAVHSIQSTDSLVLQNKSEFFYWVISLGKYGVELFFFLSGWLLISIYGTNENRLGKAYWARRLARIYPLWILFLLIAFLRWEYTNSGQLHSPIKSIDGESNFLHSPAGVIVLSLSFTLFISASLWNGVIPGGWSIQAEVAHYILFPSIRKRSLNSVLKIVASINFLTSAVYSARPRLDTFQETFLIVIDAWIRLGLYSTVGYFLIGILSYTVFNHLKGSRITELKFSDLNISHNAFTVFCISLLLVPCPFGNQIEAIGYLLLMILISFGVLRNQKLNSIFRFLGRYSYFIYFMHFLALASVNWITSRLDFTTSQLGAQQVVFIVIFLYSLTISSVLAVPSMKFLERPFMKMAHNLK